jgi:hypothetical protein
VHNFRSGISSPWRTLLNRLHQLEKPLVGVLLAVGCFTGISAAAQSSEAPLALRQASIPSLETNGQPLADGVYLYGQSTEPDQIGSAYMVFEVNNRQVVGAFYMPSSSFDCFQGELQADQLALTVTNSYEQIAYPYQIALQPGAAVAMAGEATVPMQLEGYHYIETVSENDQRLLSVCKADLQPQ